MKGQISYFLVLVAIGLLIFAWAEVRKASVSASSFLFQRMPETGKENLYSYSLLGMWSYAVDASEYLGRPIYVAQMDSRARAPPANFAYLVVASRALEKFKRASEEIVYNYSCVKERDGILSTRVEYYLGSRRIEREVLARSEPGLERALQGVVESSRQFFENVLSPCFMKVRICSLQDAYSLAMQGLEAVAGRIPKSYPLECTAKLVGVNFTKHDTCEEEYFCNPMASGTDADTAGACDSPSFRETTYTGLNNYLPPAHVCQRNRKVDVGFTYLITCRYWEDFVLKKEAIPSKVSALVIHHVSKSGICYDEELLREEAAACFCNYECWTERRQVPCQQPGKTNCYVEEYECREIRGRRRCVFMLDYDMCGDVCQRTETRNACSECSGSCSAFLEDAKEVYSQNPSSGNRIECYGEIGSEAERCYVVK